MKFAKAKEGERFVFPDRGGLWVKTSKDEAEMTFPQKRKCSGISPDLEVCVIFARDEKRADGSLKIALIDRDTDSLLLEIPEATAQQVVAYSYAEQLKITPKGKRKVREYCVDEVEMDHDSQSLVLKMRDVTDATID
jgi:hypothetical protein